MMILLDRPLGSQVLSANWRVSCLYVTYETTPNSFLSRLLVPCRGYQLPSNTFDDDTIDFDYSSYDDNTLSYVSALVVSTATITVIGTFFEYRRNRVRFCLHDTLSSRPTTPLLLLEFTVPTAYLA
ncbi:hypothetical protein Cni_G15658 [Canna indica]|uniref:Uncharacterized protein n=1 Tax=Canna indica TaxID=4628 RepID=A0AAQ3KHF1_9LILI|nr:hypothetical protein Cni_G15658 [Canna indica]